MKCSVMALTASTPIVPRSMFSERKTADNPTYSRVVVTATRNRSREKRPSRSPHANATVVVTTTTANTATCRTTPARTLEAAGDAVVRPRQELDQDPAHERELRFGSSNRRDIVYGCRHDVKSSPPKEPLGPTHPLRIGHQEDRPDSAR